VTAGGLPPLELFANQLAEARAADRRFDQQSAARFLHSGSLFVIFVFSWIAATLSGLAFESLGWPWVIAGGAIAAGLTALIYVFVRPIVVRRTVEAYQDVQSSLTICHRCLDAAKTLAVADADRTRHVLKRRRGQKIATADEEKDRQLSLVNTQRETELRGAGDLQQQRRQEAIRIRDGQQADINGTFDQERQSLQLAYDSRLQELRESFDRELSAARESHQRSWERVVRRWYDGLAELQEVVDQQQAFCQAQFPAWGGTDWTTWTPPDQDLPLAQLGHLRIRLDQFEGGLSDLDELRPDRDEFLLPMLTAFDEKPLMLWEAWGDARAPASRSMRHAMLRLFTSLPPGKVRFTIIDPVGLGQNFSAFMHLADLDEKLVNHRIWTESSHIDQRLADLTEHMEDVIQTYLRNEFDTIDQYNRHAGEVAEPFHVLVVANFPAGFSDDAAARLLSVANSGARCGVFTLISTDSNLELPRNFQMADLEAHSLSLHWTGQGFRWWDESLCDLQLELDDPPPEAKFTEVLQVYGQRAKEAHHVEVPFATVAPAPDDWWNRTSERGLDVALGRAGATKLQRLRLGHGTSQHVLISGKTGSGKSTLLHALITNTAMHYSPAEVEFYLIDFKKGVEFKPYAEHRLPHARVIAIESEREFGMSVLGRLDDELRRRGDLYREHGVQDLVGFRTAAPQIAMPRILLIIDEFQEFFVQDDKLSQDAALLLDRLVRQGRAFGIHVLLGSQTLAGAYSLARSTIGQMAVRIALQCSEADSHLILSEDNNAARLLNRPGEAIYNDANGLFEGNHPFQVVWLSSEEQESHLRQMADRDHRPTHDLSPLIVFEGNVAANAADNHLLVAALSGETTAEMPRGWLGAAVAIKEPTSVQFQRQSGANLLVVGQQEETAFGILSNALVSLWATSRRDSVEPVRFVVLDGSRSDVPGGGWQDIADAVPAAIQVVTADTMASAVYDVYQELEQRLEGKRNDAPLFLVVHHLARFRELRKAEDDFGFGGLDEDAGPPKPSAQLLSLLREGPAHGIYTLLFCDTYNNLTRWLDRQTLRELDHRVLFQMSATDSSNLMDSPDASRLGVHRALLFSEEQGTMEKFRPYGPPSDRWLRTIDELADVENTDVH
jgi:hypothetical protein